MRVSHVGGGGELVVRMASVVCMDRCMCKAGLPDHQDQRCKPKMNALPDLKI